MPPNILFLMTDQQRADALSLVGGWCQTPNLDRLVADGGVHFRQCITTSPVCIPARVTMATGLYPHNTGVWDNGHYTMPPTSRTWMQVLREAGYRTSLFGKTHLHPHAGDLREREHLLRAYGLDDVNETVGPRASARALTHMTMGWHDAGLWDAHAADYADRFRHDPTVVRPSALPLEHYYDTYVGQRANDYLRAYRREQPWCCWVSFGGPHEPWDTPEPYASRYAPGDMPAPLPRFADEHPRAKGNLDRKDDGHRPAISPERVAAMRANYAGNVALIDDRIGQLIDTIKRRGEWDRTIVAMTSDHGEMNGDHGLVYKSTFLDSALRVPLLISTPATRAAGQARTSDALAEWFDVGPTLVELAGAKLPYAQNARSLVPILDGRSDAVREVAISELSREICLFDHDWKLVLNANAEPILLFDRRNDPDEQRNLAGDPQHAQTAAHLRERALAEVFRTLVPGRV